MADTLARRWLIPSPQPDMTDQEQLEELERHIRKEIVMEQVKRGLPRELQARIDARGPRDVEELKSSIREYQLQHNLSIPAKEEQGLSRLEGPPGVHLLIPSIRTLDLH